jgi:hypothetical protein
MDFSKIFGLEIPEILGTQSPDPEGVSDGNFIFILSHPLKNTPELSLDF